MFKICALLRKLYKTSTLKGIKLGPPRSSPFLIVCCTGCILKRCLRDKIQTF